MLRNPAHTLALTLGCFVIGGSTSAYDDPSATAPSFDNTPWKQNAFAEQRFLISGTGDRNNPIRRRLKRPITGNELFVRFRLHYAADSIDLPPRDGATPDPNIPVGDGEFFVLWLDSEEGGDRSTHSSGVPNVGLHVANSQNRFMIRFSTSTQRFAGKLSGDQDFLLVARLAKSEPGANKPFDQLELWIDPSAEAESQPIATTNYSRAIASVQWIGFSTGAKTELDDRIQVWDIAVANSWAEIMDLPMNETSAPRVPEEDLVDFRQEVFPILRDACFDCHAGESPEGPFRIDVLDDVLSHAVPGTPNQSPIYQSIASGSMPPADHGAKLTTSQTVTIERWIRQGLTWDEGLLPTPQPQSNHWSLQPLLRPALPQNPDSNQALNPIDAFIAREHRKLGIVPAPRADPQTLSRRLSLTTRGLPPEQTHAPTESSGAPVQTPQPDQAAIQRLLQDPSHGERIGRYWLDIARWAESNGHQHNRSRPHAWRYRDWVVSAFNNNLPFDQFIERQLAGDLIEPLAAENLIATGFLSAARYSGNELDKQIQRNDLLVDMANTTASAMMGLTMECAQCHSHKFDPLSISDYYRFQAFFADGQPENVITGGDLSEAKQLSQERWALFDRVHHRLLVTRRKRGQPEPIYITPTAVVGGMRPAEKQRYRELEQLLANFPQTWAFCTSETAERMPIAPKEMRWPLPRPDGRLAGYQARIRPRGEVHSLGPVVTPGWPAIFDRPASETRLNRLDLAQWLTTSENPLTARVWVNRIWQWYFGVGLVTTSADFGTQGARPNFPELLDYLAVTLVESGWNTQAIERLILQSDTFQRASSNVAASYALDPENKTLWRWTPRRLEAEAIRDCVLAVSGQLDPSLGGPSVPESATRRSLYLQQKRDHLPHQQVLFGGPEALSSCSRRVESSTPLQPLWLMNNPLMQNAAQAFAKRAGSIEQAFHLALHRAPTAAELDALRDLEEQHGLSSVCLALLNSSEFLYIP